MHREKTYGYQTISRFLNKLEKLLHLASWGYAHGHGGIYAADRMRSRRENERLLTERACTVSGSSLRFIVPVETAFPFPTLHAEKPSFTNPTDIAYRVQGQCPWCGVRGRRAPAKGAGPQKPCEESGC